MLVFTSCFGPKADLGQRPPQAGLANWRHHKLSVFYPKTSPWRRQGERTRKGNWSRDRIGQTSIMSGAPSSAHNRNGSRSAYLHTGPRRG